MIDHTTVSIRPLTKDLLPTLNERKIISPKDVLIISFAVAGIGGIIYVLSKFRAKRKTEES